MPSVNLRHKAKHAAPDGKATDPLAIRRRDALKFLASGLAVTLAGCSDPLEERVPYKEEIIPYVDMPERLVAGEPQYYATALSLSGFARGALVKAIDGRPIKVEGNPHHPASRGATDIFMQAEILSLYEPDRSGTVAGPQPIATWETFQTALKPRMQALDDKKGTGFHLVTGRVTSPTLKRQIADFLKRYPNARWHAYEPAEGDLHALPAEHRRPRLDQADVIVSLDADPLGPGPDQIINGREFAARRDPTSGKNVARVYVVESARTLTGANADHRLSLAPDAIETFATALAAQVTGGDARAADALPDEAGQLLQAAVGDVTAPGKKAILLGGETLSADVRGKLTEANSKLGAKFEVTTENRSTVLAPLADLWSALEAGEVTDLVMLDRNLVYDFPDKKLKKAVSKVAFSVHAGRIQDETAEASKWHLPLSHVLESWSDATATDGTVSVIQPLIRPLYATRTAHEIMAILMGDPAPSGYEIVRQTWRGGRSDADFESWWRKTLVAGIVPKEDVPARASLSSPAPATRSPNELVRSGGNGKFTAIIRPDPTLYDGTQAENALLQECPKPISKITWANVVTLSEADAKHLGVETNDVVAVEAADGRIEGPVLIDHAQADGVVGLTLGYGRGAAGAIGTGLGYNARELSPRAFATLISGVDVKKTDKHDPVPNTQEHFKLEGEFERLMPIVSGATQFELDKASLPDSGQHFNHPNPKSDGYSWAMVIDNAACIGCNACVIACQAENNVPVVGPEEVANHRIMQWLRIDRYEHADSPSSAVGGFEPVPCMQCEKAPCEPVCPVEASVHDIEGINNQVYNRCVGTRFCQTNCPYKVRHFNWFAYNAGQEYKNLGENPMPAEKNPDVTVRGRGVMEKCTYCVQRISRARRDAEKTDERIPDGAVRTACQQACPTDAIQFGNLQDLGSRVSKLKHDPRHFTLLEELGTSPRTTYLARLRNANPDLSEDES